MFESNAGPEVKSAEFTGERVIPGLVDQDLFNEHVARYRFALQFLSRFSHRPRVTDAGCGSGYGSALLAEAAEVTGCDISGEAVRHAREHFGGTGAAFVQASCEALPVADGVCDLVTAFEVIEHLERWPLLLSEAKRVLKGSGVLLVSTPNKSYYAESRAKAGPNPFHTHEFEPEEFREALQAVFPHVQIWTQNHSEAIVFAPAQPANRVLDADGDNTPENAHFFLAACSENPLEAQDIYAWLPSSANLLRERERHIGRLEGELARKDQWLNDLSERHSSLQASHEATLLELRERNGWAEGLNREIGECRAIIAHLQVEAAASLEWARALEAQIHAGNEEIRRLNQVSGELEAEVAARTDWARHLEEQLSDRTLHVRQLQSYSEELEGHLKAQNDRIAGFLSELGLIANSRWVRVGRKFGLGPVITHAGEE